MSKWRSPVAALLLALMAVPVLAQRGAARPQITPPDGPVWQIIRKNCTGCHGIDDYAFHALDRAGWQIAHRNEAQGPESLGLRGKIRSSFSTGWFPSSVRPRGRFPARMCRRRSPHSLPTWRPRACCARSCESCHDLVVVNNSRFAADRWRVILVTMRERGAVLTDEELERMVEWLGRVKGVNPNQ